MREEEIDKVFREGLRGAEAPVFDSDWENFSTMRKRGGYSFWKYALPILIFITLISGASYVYFTDFTGNKTAQNAEKQQPKSSIVQLENTANTAVGPEVEISDSGGTGAASIMHGAATSNSGDLSSVSLDAMKAKDAQNDDILNTNDQEVLVDIGISPISDEGEHILSGAAATEWQDSSESQGANLSGLAVKSGFVASQVQSKAEVNRVGSEVDLTAQEQNNAGKINRGEAPESPIAAGPKTRDDRAENRVQVAIPSENGETSEFAPQNIQVLLASAIAIESTSPKFSAESRPVEVSKDMHYFAAYFGVEQNDVLGMSPSLGIMSFWSLNRWSMGAGLGYQRSGALNWSQETTQAVYGFDRYEARATLRTSSIDMLTLPLSVSRKIGGVSSLFAGITPAVLINARQELFIADDSNLSQLQPETGYLYSTESPEFMYFISAGYTHHFTTWWSLDLGATFTFQEWESVEQAPLGIFLRTHIRIR